MKEKDGISVGGRIRQERERLGWSQEELAEQAGLSTSSIGQYERGVKTPSLGKLKQLADTLRVTAASLLEERPPRAAKDAGSLPEKAAELLRERSPEQQKLMYLTLRHLARQSRRMKR